MNAVAIATYLPAEGGFYAGRILVAGVEYGLIAAPKAEGERGPSRWAPRYDYVEGALSYSDGLVNTLAMAEADSELARWALDLRIGGLADWYLGALDDYEIAYRVFKPTADANSLWNRSGINVSAVPPTYPYTAESPQQTSNELFHAGGSEAFAPTAYWTSTQHASDGSYAWAQTFCTGGQDFWLKLSEFRARAFRRFRI